MTKTDQEKNNQFATGLIIGFLLGTTGYFLVNTDQGKELKENFKQKWQGVQAEMPQVAEFQVGDLKIKDLINVLLGIDSVDKIGRKKTVVIKEASRPQLSDKSKKPKKFKGT